VTFCGDCVKTWNTSPRTLSRTDLAALPWQRPVSHFCPNPAFSGETRNGCHPPPTQLPWFGTLWLLISKKKLKLKACRLDTIEEIQAESQCAWHTDRKELPGIVSKMEGTVGLVSTCGMELRRGWWRPIGLMVSFMIFTASVRNIFDIHS
jgi:hypothetical protein